GAPAPGALPRLLPVPGQAEAGARSRGADPRQVPDQRRVCPHAGRRGDGRLPLPPAHAIRARRPAPGTRSPGLPLGGADHRPGSNRPPGPARSFHPHPLTRSLPHSLTPSLTTHFVGTRPLIPPPPRRSGGGPAARAVGGDRDHA